MSEVRLTAQLRTEFGKGAARRTRRAHLVPAVLYGHGTPPRHLSLPGHDLMLALKSPNVLLSLDIDGTTELALPKAVQRDPMKGFLEHVDLLLVRRGEQVTVEVPLVLTGEVVPDGLLTHDLTTLEVQAEATHIPAEITIDVEGLQVGQHVTAGEVPLPAGVTLVTEPTALVLAVTGAPTAEQVEASLSAPTGEAAGTRPAPAETGTAVS